MIIDGSKNIDVISEGVEMETVKTELDVDNIGFIINMLSKFYADPIGSTIREWASNALDSHIEAGVNKPIVVKLFEENNLWWFSVQDFGVGVDQDTITNIFSKYGKSTKRHSNDLLGAMGLGLKSGLSYSSYFTIEGVKNGIRGSWIFREDENGSTIDVVYNDLPTSEENGAIFKIPVENSDIDDFSSKIREQLCYFRNVFVSDEYIDFDNNFVIYESEDFKYSSINEDKHLHICLGDVYYPIDYNKLGISSINLPIGLKFGLGEGIKPIENRENIRYTNESKDLILKKIARLADWMIDRYNKSLEGVNSWKEGRNLIRKDNFIVKVEDTNICIDEIISYSSRSVKQVDIVGFDAKYLFLLRGKENNICNIVNTVGRVNKSFFSQNFLAHSFDDNKVKIIVDRSVVGKFREYIKEKYPICNIYRDGDIRVLGKKNSSLSYRKNEYISILSLKSYPKSEWRNIIKQAQIIEKEYRKEFIDLSGFVVPEDWLRERRIKRVSNYKSLNKQEGQITISILRKSLRSIYEIAFDKKVMDISSLSKNEGIIIYGTKNSHEEKLKYIFEYTRKKNYILVCVLNKTEEKYIKHIKQFIHINDIMKLSLSRRLFTAYKGWEISEILKKFYSKDNKILILNLLGSKYKRDFEKLQSYIKSYIDWEFLSSPVGKEIIEYMEEYNIIDEEMYEVIRSLSEFARSIAPLALLEVPLRNTYNETDEQFEKKEKIYLNTVHKFLIFEKLYKNNFEDWTLCPPSSIDQETNDTELINNRQILTNESI